MLDWIKNKLGISTYDFTNLPEDDYCEYLREAREAVPTPYDVTTKLGWAQWKSWLTHHHIMFDLEEEYGDD